MEHKLICNCCGKEIGITNGIPQEDYLHISKEWGYFSKKDGRLQELTICEDCFDGWTSRFRVPVKTTEVTEFV